MNIILATVREILNPSSWWNDEFKKVYADNYRFDLTKSERKAFQGSLISFVRDTSQDCLHKSLGTKCSYIATDILLNFLWADKSGYLGAKEEVTNDQIERWYRNVIKNY